MAEARIPVDPERLPVTRGTQPVKSGRWRWLAVNVALFIAASTLSAFFGALLAYGTTGGFAGWEGQDPVSQVVGYALLSLPYLYIFGLLPIGMLLAALVIDARLIRVPRFVLALVGLAGGYVFALFVGGATSVYGIGPLVIGYAPAYVLLGLLVRRR